MADYALPSLSGVIITYSNKYFTFSFEDVQKLNIDFPIEKITLCPTNRTDYDGATIEVVSAGKNKPTVITFTVECKNKKVGEIGLSFMENIANYDTAGTLEILEVDGSLFTCNSAVLCKNPVFNRDMTSTDDVISYDFVFNTDTPISG